MGEIAAEFNDVSFFVAACYKSQADLTYLSLQSQKVAFQHAPVVPQASHESMESAFSGAELQSTLYHTEPGVRQGDGRTGEPMFAFAIKVSADTSKNIKVKKRLICLVTLFHCTGRRKCYFQFSSSLSSGGEVAFWKDFDYVLIKFTLFPPPPPRLCSILICYSIVFCSILLYSVIDD